MSNCTNCFNGCTEIISDRCVKYTGIDIPELGILTGDTLSSVEQSITTYLVSVLDGSGVKIDLSSIDICLLVQSYLPVCSACTDISIADIAKALIQAVCDLQEQIDAIVADIVVINNDINVIEADYTVRCLIDGTPSITPSSGTHAVLQATIDALCALSLDLSTNYSSNGTELDNYIANYLATHTTDSTKYYNKMIPYTVVEYYGPLSNYPGIGDSFDGTGAGQGYWEKIYLCNGVHGTPDKRGRVGVGVTDGTFIGPTMPVETNPFTPGGFNPTYVLKGTGSTVNSTTLSEGQIPSHTHTNSITQTPHRHQVGPDSQGVLGPIVSGSPTAGFNPTYDFILQSTYFTNTTSIDISVSNNVTGGGGAHTNVQAGVGCYYIMYIP